MADEINGRDLGRVIGVSPGHVTKLTQRGVLQKTPSGRYALGASVQAFIQHERDRAKPSPVEAARARVQNAKAAREERREAQARGELVEIETGSQLLREICAMFVSELDGLPARLTRDRSELKRIAVECGDLRERIWRKLRAGIAEIEQELAKPQ